MNYSTLKVDALPSHRYLSKLHCHTPESCEIERRYLNVPSKHSPVALESGVSICQDIPHLGNHLKDSGDSHSKSHVSLSSEVRTQNFEIMFSWILCSRGHGTSFNIFDRSCVEFFISPISFSFRDLISPARLLSMKFAVYTCFAFPPGSDISLSTVCSVSVSPIRHTEQNCRQSTVLISYFHRAFSNVSHFFGRPMHLII